LELTTAALVAIFAGQAAVLLYETFGYLTFGGPYYLRAPFRAAIDRHDLSDLDLSRLPYRKGRTPRMRYQYLPDQGGLALADRPSPSLRRQLSCMGYLQFRTGSSGTEVEAWWAPVYWMSWGLAPVVTPVALAVGLWPMDSSFALATAGITSLGLLLLQGFVYFKMKQRFIDLYGEVGQQILDDLASGQVSKTDGER